jgi:hypothetical protein
LTRTGEIWVGVCIGEDEMELGSESERTGGGMTWVGEYKPTPWPEPVELGDKGSSESETSRKRRLRYDGCVFLRKSESTTGGDAGESGIDG